MSYCNIAAAAAHPVVGTLVTVAVRGAQFGAVAAVVVVDVVVDVVVVVVVGLDVYVVVVAGCVTVAVEFVHPVCVAGQHCASLAGNFPGSPLREPKKVRKQ